MALAEEETNVGYVLRDVSENEYLGEYALNPENTKCYIVCNYRIRDIQYSLVHALIVKASKCVTHIYKRIKRNINEVTIIATQCLKAV